METPVVEVVDVPSVTLSDGLQVPLVGFGTSRVLDVDQNKQNHLSPYEAIKTAIKCGYRFIDTAAYYLNEQVVGQAVRDSIKENIIQSRDQLIICTKVWCTSHKRESVLKACRESLAKMQLDYLDIYLIHWPMAYAEDERMTSRPNDDSPLRYSDTHFTETWRGMEDVKDAGLAKSIGVSNFNHKQINEILAMPCKHRPTINQVECHPYLSQAKLQAFCQKENIYLHAHCPLGSPASCARPGQPKLLDDLVINQMAQKYQKSVAQILIRYLVQRKIGALPKSMTALRIQQNLNIGNFELTQEDLAKLIALDKNLRYCRNADVDVSDHPLFPFHEEY